MLNKIEKLLEKIGVITSWFVGISMLLIFKTIKATSFQEIYVHFFILLLFFISFLLNRVFYEVLCKFIRLKIPYIIFVLPLVVLAVHVAFDILLKYYIRYFNIYTLLVIVVCFLFMAIISCIIFGFFKLSKILQKLTCKFIGFKYEDLIYLLYMLLLGVLAIYLGYIILTKGYYFALMIFIKLGWI